MGMSCDRKAIVFTTKTPEVTQGGQDYGKIIIIGSLGAFWKFPSYFDRDMLTCLSTLSSNIQIKNIKLHIVTDTKKE